MKKFSLLLLCFGAFVTACSPDSGSDAPADETPQAETRTFWAWDLSVMPPSEKQIEATNRLTSEHAYFYVENALWDSGDVTLEQLEALSSSLEKQTPKGSVAPERGIVANNIEMFGPIPDMLDGDPRMFIFITNIEGFNGTQFDGFFRAMDQMKDSVSVKETGYHSNEIEMLFINGKIRPVNSIATTSVIAHEMFHLIEYGLDPAEGGWMSEALAEVAMTINGYYTDQAWVSDFMGAPNTALKGGQFSVHYGALLLWGNYLLEQFGPEFIGKLASDTRQAESAINHALVGTGSGMDFMDVFQDWVVANVAHAPGILDNRYGYQFADVPVATPWRTVNTLPQALGMRTVKELAAEYVRVQDLAGATLKVTVPNPANARLAVVRYSTTNDALLDVTYPPVNATETIVPIDLSMDYDAAYLALMSTREMAFTVAAE